MGVVTAVRVVGVVAEWGHRRVTGGQSKQARPLACVRVLHHHHLRATEAGTGVHDFGLRAVREEGGERYTKWDENRFLLH